MHKELDLAHQVQKNQKQELVSSHTSLTTTIQDLSQQVPQQPEMGQVNEAPQ
jgi:hypothetical protein